MSRKERERKEMRLEEIAAEKLAAKQRREERMAPIYKATKKALFTFFGTVVLLVIGYYVSGHLHEIGQKLLHR